MKGYVFACSLCLQAVPAFAQDLGALVRGELPDLVATYKDLHAHPELSHREVNTAALLASELQTNPGRRCFRDGPENGQRHRR